MPIYKLHLTLFYMHTRKENEKNYFGIFFVKSQK